MRISWLAAMIVSMVSAAAPGQTAPQVPEGGTSMIAEGGVAAMRFNNRADAEASITQAPGRDGKVLRFVTRKRPESPWLMQATAKSTVDLKRGDICLVTFWARAVETSDEMSEATLGVVFEHSGPPNTKSLQRALKLDTQWRQFAFPFAMQTDEPAGSAQFNLLVGYMPQVVDVADLQVLTYYRTRQVRDLPMQGAQVRYAGRDADAPWRKAAAERIEQHRKGNLAVLVTDAEGRPVADAQVTVEMKRHVYHFGSAVTAQLLTVDSDDGRRYREIVESNFNAVVFENDLKYGPWVLGKTTARSATYNNENTLAALKWLKERGMFVRGHCLLWGPLDKSFYPAARGFDFDAADPAKNRVLVESYMDDILAATNGMIDEWDAVNHPVATWGDRGRCWTDLFGREFYASVFHKARTANRKMRLFVNEGADLPGDNERARQEYGEIIAWLIENKVPLDGIGFMGHFGASSLSSIDYIYKHVERYSKFGLPMRITELDVSTDGDEQVQADYLRDVMTMFFSHPQTDGIILWGFWESRHWKPETALWRRDWQIKPVGQAWLDLVKKQWWTRANGQTDRNGRFAMRGFKGDYVVKVTHGGKTQEVKAIVGDEETESRVQLP